MFDNTSTLLTDIINLIDKNVYLKFKEDSAPLCLCLSWAITLFTHEINNFYTIRRILDYLLINEPINVYILTAIIICKNLQKRIKNIKEAEKEDIFLGMKDIDLNKIDFNYMIVECDKFIKNNEENILGIQDKNQDLLYLIGDYNYRGIESIVYLYNKEVLPDRYIKKNKSFFPYILLFILFLVYIFVSYYFRKDRIFNELKGNIKLNENITNINKTQNDEDEEF